MIGHEWCIVVAHVIGLIVGGAIGYMIRDGIARTAARPEAVWSPFYAEGDVARGGPWVIEKIEYPLTNVRTETHTTYRPSGDAAP